MNRNWRGFSTINDQVDAATLVHFMRYDSVHGFFAPQVQACGDRFSCDGKEIRVLTCPGPGGLPWWDLEVDLASFMADAESGQERDAREPDLILKRRMTRDVLKEVC